MRLIIDSVFELSLDADEERGFVDDHKIASATGRNLERWGLLEPIAIWIVEAENVKLQRLVGVINNLAFAGYFGFGNDNGDDERKKSGRRNSDFFIRWTANGGHLLRARSGRL